MLLTERPSQSVTAQFADPTLDGLVWCIPPECMPWREACTVEVFSRGSEPVVEAVDGWWLVKDSEGQQSWVHDGRFNADPGGVWRVRGPEPLGPTPTPGGPICPAVNRSSPSAGTK